MKPTRERATSTCSNDSTGDPSENEDERVQSSIQSNPR
jgi:hypothetical protein